jgi:hypothetical protein
VVAIIPFPYVYYFDDLVLAILESDYQARSKLVFKRGLRFSGGVDLIIVKISNNRKG